MIDFWSCKSGNLKVIWLLLYTIQVLATFIGKRQSDTLPAPSWKWVTMKPQQFLPFHYGKWQHDVAVFVYIRSVHCKYRLNCSRTLSCSIENEISCYCPGGCHGNIFCLCAYKGFLGNISCLSAYNSCQLLVYWWQRSSTIWITQDVRPTIIDAQLTLVLKMEQGVCSFLICP